MRFFAKHIISETSFYNFIPRKQFFNPSGVTYSPLAFPCSHTRLVLFKHDVIINLVHSSNISTAFILCSGARLAYRSIIFKLLRETLLTLEERAKTDIKVALLEDRYSQAVPPKIRREKRASV